MKDKTYCKKHNKFNLHFCPLLNRKKTLNQHAYMTHSDIFNPQLMLLNSVAQISLDTPLSMYVYACERAMLKKDEHGN